MPNQDGMEIPSVSILLHFQWSCDGGIPVPEGGLLGFVAVVANVQQNPFFCLTAHLVSVLPCKSGRCLLVVIY